MSESELQVSGSSPSPERVAELVRALAAVMQQSEVSELDLEMGTMSLRLRRPDQCNAHQSPVSQQTEALAPASEIDPGHVISAPMVGTFYSSATPSASPFVTEGDEIVAGQTIGIIEAMKIMNEIAADRSGLVKEFIVQNGQPVEYGSPLIRLAAKRDPS